MAKAAKKSKASNSSKRTEIAPNNDKRYVKRKKNGEFDESDDVSKSLRQDVKQTAKKKVKPGYGDQGDQAKKSPKSKK